MEPQTYNQEPNPPREPCHADVEHARCPSRLNVYTPYMISLLPFNVLLCKTRIAILFAVNIHIGSWLIP